MKHAVDIIENVFRSGFFADSSIDLCPDFLIQIRSAGGVERAGFGVEVEREDGG